MQRSNEKKRSGLLARRKLVFGLGAAVAALVLVGLVVVVMAGGSSGSAANVPTFPVARGPLTISVTESGTITAKDQVVIKSQVEGRATIIYLVEEGQHVNEGDLLVELDSSGLQTDLVEQEIKVQNAISAHVQAQEVLAATRLQAQADLSQAELDHEFAKQDLAKYIDGDYPTEEQTAESEIKLKEEELTQAKQTLDWSQRLFDEDYLSKNELEKDKLAYNRAQIDLELARRTLEVLQNYNRPRQIATLESAIMQTGLALEKARRSTAADVVKAEADERAKGLEYANQKGKLDRLKDQIVKCKMIAPTSGMVVYATTGKGGWRPQEPLEEGQEVRERQELIYLPTASTKTAEVKIHESALEKVSVGMPVRVLVDAMPGRSFRGRVSKISPLPDAQSVWMNPDLKVYNTQIDLEGNFEEIRTGMTCRAEILVNHYQDTTYVPVQAVVRVGNQPTVWVRQGDEFVPREVEIGLSNNRMVRVTKGLEMGELVTLTPPLAPAAAEEPSDMATASLMPGDETRSPVDAATPAAPADATGEASSVDAAAEGEPAVPSRAQRQAMRDAAVIDAVAAPAVTAVEAKTQ